MIEYRHRDFGPGTVRTVPISDYALATLEVAARDAFKGLIERGVISDAATERAEIEVKVRVYQNVPQPIS